MYTTGMAGPNETKDLIRQWAWQITELGIHRRETASLYQPHDHVQSLFGAYFYTDM